MNMETVTARSKVTSSHWFGSVEKKVNFFSFLYNVEKNTLCGYYTRICHSVCDQMDLQKAKLFFFFNPVLETQYTGSF
jgi:hypothetical protein